MLLLGIQKKRIGQNTGVGKGIAWVEFDRNQLINFAKKEERNNEFVIRNIVVRLG